MLMESHGIPGKVHISQASLNRLFNSQYIFKVESRGDTANVPGETETYIVHSRQRASKLPFERQHRRGISKRKGKELNRASF